MLDIELTHFRSVIFNSKHQKNQINFAGVGGYPGNKGCQGFKGPDGPSGPPVSLPAILPLYPFIILITQPKL